jgi:hypothetical protein
MKMEIVKQRKIVITIIILLLPILLISIYSIMKIINKYYPIANCKIQNGEWNYFDNKCVTPFPDTGNRCNDYKDCNGSCILENFSWDIQPIPTAGVCSSTNPLYGCHYYLEYPEVKEMCID